MNTENSEQVVNKLILLFILNIISTQITNLQLMKLVLELKYMNYFEFQLIINNLLNSNHITKETKDNSTYLNITPEGIKTIEFFKDRIPHGIITYFTENIGTIRNKIKNESFISSSITTDSPGQYILNLKVQEDDFSLIDLKITVGTNTDAQIMQSNWKKHSQVIYNEIIQSLTQKRDVLK